MLGVGAGDRAPNKTGNLPFHVEEHRHWTTDYLITVVTDATNKLLVFMESTFSLSDLKPEN